MFERVDRLRILLELRVGRTEKVPGIGVVRIDLRNASEGFDRLLRDGRILVVETEVIPGMSVFRIIVRGFLEKCFCFIDALQVQQSDAAIQRCDFQIRIFRRRLFKRLQPFLEQLLVHVGDADIVQAARGFLGIGAGRGGCDER